MTPVTHQTVRLSRGNHRSPEHGACVMELASMLAGEPFSDHPRSVCPMIGGLLRTYNDLIDDDRRQDLYRFAAAAVGTRATPEIEHRRAVHATAWAREHRQPSRLNIFHWSWLQNLLAERVEDLSAGTAAIRVIRRHDDRTHAAVLALIDELIAIGRPAGELPAPVSGACARSYLSDDERATSAPHPEGGLSTPNPFTAHRRN